MTKGIPSGRVGQQPSLISYYKPIGPAAIVAALPHTLRKHEGLGRAMPFQPEFHRVRT